MNFNKANAEKIYTILGHVAYLLLFVFAAIFYKERIIYSDAAFYTFKMIHFNSFNIEFNRYASILYELPSYFALKSGLPLKTIIFLFSINIIFISYLCYIICIKFLKNYACAFTILFLNFVGVSSSFFFPISELNIGIMICLLFYAWLEKHSRSSINFKTIVIGTLFLIAGFLSHPGVATIFIFLISYYVVRTNQWKNVNIYILLAVFLVIFIVKSLQLTQNTYESGILASLNNYKLLFDLSQAVSVKYYFFHHFKVYYLNHLVFFFTIFLFFKRKQYKILSFYFIAYLAALLFYFILYINGESSEMMEKAFSPITVFLFIPFFTEIFFNTSDYLKIKVAFLAIVVILGFLRFIDSGKHYINHIQYIDKITHNASSPKTIRIYDDSNKKYLLIPWAVGVETLLYSSLEGAEHSKTVYFIKSDEKLDSTYMSNPNTFLCVTFWPYWDSKKLNSKYFKLPETPYTFQNEEN